MSLLFMTSVMPHCPYFFKCVVFCQTQAATFWWCQRLGLIICMQTLMFPIDWDNTDYACNSPERFSLKTSVTFAFPSHQGAPWFLQPFKGDREQPHSNTNQLFYYPWMHFVKSHIYFSSNNLYFSISLWKLNIQRKANTTLIPKKISKFLGSFSFPQ